MVLNWVRKACGSCKYLNSEWLGRENFSLSALNVLGPCVVMTWFRYVMPLAYYTIGSGMVSSSGKWLLNHRVVWE